jgi:hypothetical protein
MITKSSREISFYVDTLIVQTILEDQTLTKKAEASGLVMGLIDKVKEYVGNHINSEDKVGSFLNIIAPGAITVAFSAMGLRWLGVLIGLSMNVFHIDVKGILSSIYDKIKSLLSSKKQLTSGEVDNIVTTSVESHSKPATEEDVAKLPSSTAQQLKDAKLLKLAMINYSSLEKTAKPGSGLPDLLSIFGAKKARTESLLGKVLGWVFKVALASAGLMIAGDVVNKFLNRPNAIDGSLKDGKPIETSIPVSNVQSRQTKFKVNSNYKLVTKNNPSTPWIEKYVNNKSGIENMIIDFTKEVYSVTSNIDSIIRSLPAFQAVVDKIEWYNQSSAGAPMVFIPRMFTSEKSVVDYFIDDLAEKSK